MARRTPSGARVTCPPLREILRPKDVQRTLLAFTQEDLRHVHKVAVPDTQLTVPISPTHLPEESSWGPWCDTQPFIERERLDTASTAQGAWSGTLFSLV